MRKLVHVPATDNSPGFGSYLCPLCPPVGCGTPPGGGECKRKASCLVRWSCIALIWADLRCGIGPSSGWACSTALPPTQNMEAKGPPLLDGY